MNDSTNGIEPQDGTESEASTQRRSRLVWLVSGVAVIVVLVVAVVAVVVIRIVMSTETIDVPIGVYVCGSAIDLEAVTPGETPVGCRFVPAPIDVVLEESGSDTKTASVSKESGFGFHDLRDGNYDATLIVHGAIESSKISVVAIDENGGRWFGEMTTQTDANGQTEWAFPCRIEPDLKRISFYFVTSPIIPGNNA